MQYFKGSYGQYQYYVLYGYLKSNDCTTFSKKKNANFPTAGWFWGLWGTHREQNCRHWRYQMDAVSIWFISALYSVKTYAQRCKLTQWSGLGLVLPDDVYKSFTVVRLVSCCIACNSQPACQSLNFRLSNKTCQFRKETKMSIPTSLKGLFMLITHIEMRISSKHLGMLISLCLLKLCDYIVLP